MSHPEEPSFHGGEGSDDDITPAQILIDKAERVILGFFFFMLFGLAINNVWMYLIKQKMYKSVPMLVTYILLILFSGFQVFYEFYMGFVCEEHDCLYDVLLYQAKDDSYKNQVMTLYVFWRVKQQLMWGLGIFQAVIIIVLSLRLRKLD